METLFDGIPLGDITTSMTINSPAAMIFAMYLVVAEQQGADWQTLSGTIQNDILKEFIAQKEYIFPPRPSMRLITDIFAFCADATCRSGTRSRSAATTSARPARRRLQELAFTLRDGIEYVQCGRRRRARRRRVRAADLVLLQRAQRLLRGDREVPRRAPDLGARSMRERFGAKDERSWKLRFHSADGRRVAHRAAAVQQRRPHRAAGAVGGARRHQLAAHQLARRGAGAADRRRPRRWRCARSRSSRTRAASPTSSIRSAARISSSG